MDYDLITIGRVSLDLFSEQIGVPFIDIQSFDSGVGGSPTNIAIGSSRLGLNVATLTAVGNDPVGDFVLKFLQQEKVDTRFMPRKADSRTGMAVLGIEPPDKFPLVFYRENPADIHLDIDDVRQAPIATARTLLLSGTGLSRGSCRDATLYAAEVAKSSAATTTFLDLDVRPDQWLHPRAYGLNVRTLLPSVDVIIGTEEEFYAALAPAPEAVMAKHPMDGAMHHELDTLLNQFITSQPHTVLVIKRGAKGVSILHDGQTINVVGFPVEIVNTVGAGDAFASGLIYSYLQGWDWYLAGRFANACGAIVVSQHGCSKAMPYRSEVETFMATQPE
jgi:5-dehydro-2-deoxygluconokinase